MTPTDVVGTLARTEDPPLPTFNILLSSRNASLHTLIQPQAPPDALVGLLSVCPPFERSVTADESVKAIARAALFLALKSRFDSPYHFSELQIQE